MKKQRWREMPLSVYFPVAREIMILKQERDHESLALLVFDDKHNYDLVVRSLLAIGLKVVSVDSGYAALEKNLESSFALIIADLQIPGAWTFACHIKEKSPHIPVALITDQTREDTVKIIRNANVEAVLIRPLEGDDVLKTVQKILEPRPCPGYLVPRFAGI